MTTIHPLNDKILIQRVEPDAKTPGGIILPDNAKEKPKEGLVKAVGRGKVLDNGTLREPQVKRGDRVLFSSYAGQEIKVDEQDYLIVAEEEILAVVTA